jgi:hypothetical protein
MNYYWFVGALAVAAIPLTEILTFLLTLITIRDKKVCWDISIKCSTLSKEAGNLQEIIRGFE